MHTDLPTRKYPPFQPGFFTERVCKLLCDIGEGALTQQIRNVGGSHRNHHIARQEIFRKYLTAEDIATAAWICAKDNRAHPEWNNTYSGIEHLNNLLAERSEGRYETEIRELAKKMPAPAGYDKSSGGFPMPAMIAQARVQKKRDGFVLIKGGQEGAGEDATERPAL